MPLSRRFGAEFIGASWLVFGGFGSAVLAAAFPGLGIGFAGVALAMLTFMFLFIILGATDKRIPAGFATIVGGILAGLVYTRIAGRAGDSR